MNKKKAIKIATASVMAASAFSAVAPFTTEAAVNVSASVTKATTQMKKAQDTYTAAVAKGQVASASSVQKQVDLAKKYYDDAKKVIAKSGGKNKAAYTKKLNAALPYYNNAKNYIKAVQYAEALKAQAAKYEAAAKAGKVDAVAYAKFSAELAKADQTVKDLVKGGTAERAVIAKYLAPAKKSAAAVNAYFQSVKAVSAINDITVDELSASVELPKTVEVTLVNGKKAQKEVKWDTKGLDLNKPDTYTLTGDVAGTSLTASVKVVVKEVAPTVKEVSAITSKSLQVKFNKAVDPTDVKFSVKRGSAVVVLDAVFSKDNKSATLSSATPLVAGDYTVVVSGGKFEEGSNSASVKVEAEKETSLTILTESVQKLATAKFAYEVRNQYGEVMNVASSNLIVTGYDKTAKDATNTAGPVTFSAVSGQSQFQANLTGASIGVDDEILVTLSYKGLTASKTLTVKAASALSTLELAAPSPLQGKQRITVGETIELPYTAVDQYGEKVSLPSHTANADSASNLETIGDWVFTSSNPSVVNIDALTVDSNGKVEFNAAGAGTTKITAVNVKTAQITSVDVTVSAAATEDSIVLTAPTKLVADGEKVKVPFVAYDQFGGTITTANLNTSNVSLASSNTGVATVGWNGKEIEITGTGAGTAEITATIGTKVAKFSIDIQAAAVPAKITGIKDIATVLTDGATTTINPSNVVVKDQYGRDYTLKGTEGFAVYLKDGSETSADVEDSTGSNTAADLAHAGVVTNDGTTSTVNLSGKSVAGTETVVLQLLGDTSDLTTPIAGGSYEFSVSTKASADVTSYEIKDIPTLYAITGSAFSTSSYAKSISVVAKDASGNVVAIPSSAVKSVTSSNTAVATVDKATMKVLGQAKGTATISVVINTADGLKTIQKTVTVSDDARLAESIKASDAVTDGVLTYAVGSLPTSAALSTDFVVTDQYGGTALTPVDYIVSDEVDANNSMTVTVTAGALTITGADISDSVKVTGVDATGHTSTITVKFSN